MTGGDPQPLLRGFTPPRPLDRPGRRGFLRPDRYRTSWTDAGDRPPPVGFTGTMIGMTCVDSYRRDLVARFAYFDLQHELSELD